MTSSKKHSVMIQHDLGEYADILKVISNAEYALGKHLLVKQIGEKYLIKYDKSKLTNDNIDSLGLFRSVITDGKRIVSMSPVKSHNFQDMKPSTKSNPLDTKIVWHEEYIEGTMINVFWDEILDDWEIATKSNIGGKYKYFKHAKHTFRYMYLDAMNQMEKRGDYLSLIHI